MMPVNRITTINAHVTHNLNGVDHRLISIVYVKLNINVNPFFTHAFVS